MFCIVIRSYDGVYSREVVDKMPDHFDLCYWESYYMIRIDGIGKLATVVNIFEVSN